MRILYNLIILIGFLLTVISCSENTHLKQENTIESLAQTYSDTSISKIEKLKIIDSAYNSISRVKNDSIKKELLLEISYQYLKIDDSLKFLRSNKEVRELTASLGDSANTAATYWDLAHYNHAYNIEDSAYFYYNKAQKIYHKLGDDLNTARLLLNMAIIQKNIRDYTGSEVTTIKAITLLKPLKKYEWLYAAYNNLGIVFNELEQYENSLEYYNTGIDYLEKAGIEDLYPSIWNNIGLVYQESKNYKKALTYFEKAINYDVGIKDSDPGLYAMLLDNRAYTNLQSNDSLGILENFLKALEIRKDIDDKAGITINQLHLAEYFLKKTDTSTAVNYALDAKELALRSQNTRDYLSSLKFLSNTVQDSALDYSQEYIRISDSLLKKERTIRNKFARIRFETDEYISETKRLNDRILQTSLISAGIIIMIVLLFIIYNQRGRNKLIKQRNKANEEIYSLILTQQRNFEEGREKEKQHISRELHDGVLGKLFGVRLSLDSLNNEEHPEAREKRFKYIEEIQKIAEEIRLISHKLNKNSIVEVDFKVVLEELIDKQPGRIQLKMDSAINWEKLGNDIKINFYRITQEALANIQKHAKATEAKVEIRKEDNQLILEIWDNGVGFKTDKIHSGIGLKNMRNRIHNIKGQFSIKSGEEGTLIEVLVKIKNG
ncbi:MAG: sensor histidine kinase [Salegentibacter mishustinae]|nr:sensor histidine kinase [Salegentibacter mishustinae]